ncbi:YrhA family protein [Priestia megaterium]|uniref:YrhA family protein n=1 Tax=Priestia megaterium TaxID=1404 RepID=UPI00301E150C
MWRDQVSQISQLEEKWNKKLNLPSSEKELSSFCKYVEGKFGEEVLPQEYCEFLKTVNGIEFNGLIIYGMDPDFLEAKPINEVESFLDANETWKLIMDEDKLIFFGDSDIAWYCYNVSKKCFVELDKPSGEHMETFEDFNTMLKSAFSAALS